MPEIEFTDPIDEEKEKKTKIQEIPVTKEELINSLIQELIKQGRVKGVETTEEKEEKLDLLVDEHTNKPSVKETALIKNERASRKTGD